jgi:uncharacterized repeat protein (TIGR02543 family)
LRANTVPVDVSGWYLSDDFGTPKKYSIVPGSVVEAGGYFVVIEDNDGDPNNNATLPSTFFGGAFSLSSLGDEAFVFSTDGSGNLSGFSHGVSYGAAENGVSFGRWSNSEGDESFPPMESLTLGAANALPKAPDLLIDEIMYHPTTTDLDYVEVWNRSGGPLQLFDPANPSNTWRTTGIDFNFPQNQTLAADELALIVARDPESFRAVYGLASGVKIYGPYTGTLNNGGERLTIRRPDEPSADGNGGTVVPMIDVDSVRYDDQAPWPTEPDGQGPSLERINFDSYSDDPENWTASAENGGTPGSLRGLLSLSLVVQGQGSVAADPNQSNFLEGSQVSLTPTAASGWEFVNWSGDASGSAIPLFVTMNDHKTVTALFRQRYTVTTQISGQGSVSISPQQADYTQGQFVTFTATPADGSRFEGWGGSLTGNTNPVNLVVDANKVITATFIDVFTVGATVSSGEGTVIFNPSGAEFLSGTTLSVSAVPADGYRFGSWGGALSGTANPTTLPVDSNKEVTASFVKQWSLTVQADEGGSVATTPSAVLHDQGTSVTLTAQADEGFVFSGWSGGASGTSNPLVVTMDADKSITANFAAVATLTTMVNGGGSVLQSPTGSQFALGTEVTLTASADPGWAFTSWSGDLSGSANPQAITLNSNATVTANFVQLFTVGTTVSSGEGTVSFDPAGPEFLSGTALSVSAVPADGYRFGSWGGALSGTANPTTLAIDSNKEVTASFVKQWSLTVLTPEGGLVTKTPPEVLYDEGTNVTLTVELDDGYAFAGWSGSLTGTANPGSIIMDAEKTITAAFVRTYTVTVETSGSGTVDVVPNLERYPAGTVG